MPAELWAGWAPSIRRFQHRYWIHALLFGLTLATTTAVGGLHYLTYRGDVGARDVQPMLSDFLPNGLWYSLALLAILGAHEMGHYLFCRYHRVDATLPYFLPAPLLLTGTVGAFIKIREPFPTRKILFDIGVAGPIAGFVVLVPLLFVGMAWSPPSPAPTDLSQFAFVWTMGEPLLFRFAQWVVWGPVPDGYWLNLHPTVFAAWFGLLATALNLLPFGQLDGGHIAYATLRRGSTLVSLLTVAVAIGLTFVSSSWYVMTGMMLLALFAFGPRHPSVIYEDERLDRARIVVAVVAVVIFILCFTPSPIEPYELLKTP